jgi:hypothetical protein
MHFLSLNRRKQRQMSRSRLILFFPLPLTSRLPPPRAGLHQFARFVKVTARSSLAPLTYARIIIDITDMMFVLVLYLHT